MLKGSDVSTHWRVLAEKVVAAKPFNLRRNLSGDVEVFKHADRWGLAPLKLAPLKLVALFAVVVPVELYLTGGRVGAHGMHPHPYWLIVLPIAAMRGVVPGLFAAAIASSLFAVGALQAHGHFDLFTFQIMTEPILFFGVGFFVGELRDQHTARLRKRERQLEETQEGSQRLRQQRDVLVAANRLLKRRIVDESVQFGNLIAVAARLEQAGRNEVFEIALDLVEEHCGASASVLLLSDGNIDFSFHTRGSENGSPLAATRCSEFVHRAVTFGERINGFSPDEETPQDGPLAIAPLLDDDGVVQALLCLDEIPMSHLNESTITIFFGIAEWLNAALVRRAKVETLPECRETECRDTAHADVAREVFLGEPKQAAEGSVNEFLQTHARQGKPV